VARTVAEHGVEPLLSRAIAERQDWAWERGQAMGRETLATPGLENLLHALTAAMHSQRPAPAPSREEARLASEHVQPQSSS